jgi:hypothetical protein
MPKVTQLVVTMENKPGALAHICSTLGQAGVNIFAILAPEAKGKAKLRLVVDNPSKAKDFFKLAKLRVAEEDVIAVSLDNMPGALAEVAQRLARAKINVKYAYATTAGGSPKATAILAVPNVAKALAALGEA